MDNKLLNKAKQAGRREARVMVKEYLGTLEPEYFAANYIQPTPRWIPRIVWVAMVKLVVKLKQGKPIRVSLTGKDYHTLLTGDIVYKNGVQVALKDIGYKVMQKILDDVTKSNG